MLCFAIAVRLISQFHIAYAFRVNNGVHGIRFNSCLQAANEASQWKEGEDTQLVRLITPPPNLTGDLHIGNAVNLVCSDIYLKYCEMNRKLVHAKFGSDHAGLGFEKLVYRSGCKADDRHMLRDAMKSAKHLTNSHIQTLRNLGIDWFYSRWTLSSRSKDVTRDAFLRLLKEGHIREGLYPNFCTVTHGSIRWLNAAIIQFINRPIDVYSIELNVVDGEGDDSLGKVVAYTTKPGILPATAAVAVDPDVFKRFKGRMVLLPDSYRRVPLLLRDDQMKSDCKWYDTLIMPGYSQEGTNIAFDHGLETINIVDSNGRLMNVSQELQGLSLKEADEAMLKYFNTYNTVNIDVPTVLGNSNTVVYTLPAAHLLLDTAAISGPCLKEIENLEVDPPNRISLLKKRIKTNRPWCISRNGWWGVRVPIWYLEKEGENIPIPAHSQLEAEKLASDKLGSPLADALYKGCVLRQDNRILDTWFTSALWPITSGKDLETLNIPECKTERLLYTCYDILHSWVARMLLLCTYLTGGNLPFDKVVLHGMVKDDQEKKMSKSAGNTILANDFVLAYSDRDGFSGILEPSEHKQYIDQLLGKGENVIDPLAITRARLSLASYASKADKCNAIGNYDEGIKRMLKRIGQITNYICIACRMENIKQIWDLDPIDKTPTTSIVSAIGARLSQIGVSLSQFLEDFEFKQAVKCLDDYVSVFSNYAIPSHRMGDCRLSVIFNWYTTMIRMLMPFGAQLIQSISLPLELQDSGILLEWPTFERLDDNALSLFDTMEDIIRKLRRHAIGGSTTAVVSVQEKHRSEVEQHKALLSYIVKLTYNTNIDFNVE